MVKSLTGSRQSNVSFSTNSNTSFICLASSDLFLTGSSFESRTKFRVGKDCTVSNFGVHINSNTRITNTIFRVRKNGSNGNGILTVGSGATGFFEDASNTDSVVAGDDLGASATTSTGGGTIVIDGLWAALETASGGFTTHHMTTANSFACSFSTNSTRFYSAVSGSIGLNYSTTEADKAVTIRNSGVFRRMFIEVNSNTRVTDTVFTMRVNNANGAQTITVGSGATGFFEDASNTDAVASGNTVDYSGLTGISGGTISLVRWGATYDGNDNQCDMYALNNSSVQRIASSTDIFPAWFGSLNVSNTTEAQGQTKFPMDARLDKLRVKVFSNTTNAITYKLRKNGADGNQSITINAGASGLFEDASNIDDVVAGDLVNLKGSSSTNTSSYAYFALRINEPFVPAAGGDNRRIIIMQ